METTLYFLLLTLPILFTVSAIQILNTRRKSLPPGPPGLPLIGNLHQLPATPLHTYFLQLSRKYGPLIYLKLGPRPVVVANSSTMAEEILKNQDLSFCSRPNLCAFYKLSYNGFNIAFTPYSNYWREMRKICVLHLLSVKRVQSFAPIREDEVSRMIQKISQLAEKGSVVDLTERIMFLTSTIICRVAFGKRYEQGSGESKNFQHMIEEFETMLSTFYWSDYFPWIGLWVDKLTGKLSRLEKIFKVWDSFYQECIDEHQSRDRPKSSTDCDMIDILLQLRDEKLGSFDLPLDHIKAVLVDIYFAPSDTITTTIIWIMSALMKNPSSMRRAQEEIRTQLSPQNRQMVKEEYLADPKLPYLNAVIKEAMRIYTPVPLLAPRETTQKCTINGFEIPAKTLVHVNAWAISKDPEIWENPNEFLPERFLSGLRRFSLDSKGHFGLIPFGGGRRGCPGITMALTTIELAVANLLYLFDWEIPNGMTEEDIDMDIFPGVTMHKKNPLCLVPKKFM